MNQFFRIFLGQQFILPFLVIALIGGTGLVTQAVAPALAKPLVKAGESITTSSGTAEIALAEHLTRVGAIMYGAYWCSHCHNQKQLFGKEAWSKVTYVECAKDGLKANPQACNQAKVEAFPTWQIKNKRYLGTTSLFRLARASNYPGPTNFKNVMPR